MMATKEETEETRGHEHYVRYLLLLGKATPVALKLVIKDIESKHKKSLALILEENKDNFKNYYRRSYLVLFQEHEVNTLIDSWDISVLCDVNSVLLGIPDLKYIQCIRNQREDIETYRESASFTHETFKSKWDALLGAVNELIDNREGEDKYKCDRLIHSYKSINVDKGLIEKVKQTKDVNKHIEIAISIGDSTEENKQSKSNDDGSESAKRDNVGRIVIPTTFIKPLHDIFVTAQESAFFVCETNTSQNQVYWQKDGELLAEMENMIFFTKEGINCLLILRATAKDAGKYSCISGSVTTSAFLTVTDCLKIDEKLHVDEEDIKEDMKITLVCKISTNAKAPKWFHNGKEITQCCRVFAKSQGKEHKLIITRVQFEDAGEYMVAFERVASHTIIDVKDNFDLGLKHHLTETGFRNWVRGVLGLKYLKIGLENVADNAVRKHHGDILKSLPDRKQCVRCHEGNLLPCHNKKQCYRKQNKSKCLCSKPQYRRVCPTSGYCSDFYDLIVKCHRYEDPLLSNTNIGKWSSDPWSVATCYINTQGYKNKTSSREVDCSGLLCLFINNKTYLQNVDIGVFDTARIARNKILHNANYEMSQAQLFENLDQFKDVLQEVGRDSSTQVLATAKTIEACIKDLDTLKKHEIDINLTEELQELKIHAMEEDALVINKAQAQKGEELQHLKEKVKQSEEELQVIGRLRSARKHGNRTTLAHGIRNIWDSLDLDQLVDVRIAIRGPKKETHWEVIQRVYDYMSTEVKYHKKRMSDSSIRGGHNSKGISYAIHRLLHSIFSTKGTRVKKVIKSEIYPKVSLEIRCSSPKRYEKLLVVLHGAEFQESIAEFRRCLTVEKEEETTYEVEVNCSSTSMNDNRKKLCEHGILKGIVYNFTCEQHDGTQSTWYCSDHDAFCCTTCMENCHRTCNGLKKVVSDTTCQGTIERRISMKHEIGDYNVHHHSDVFRCSINCLCILPSGELLICDDRNDCLKKQDTAYNLISRSDLHVMPNDMCYIGNNRVVVALGNCSIVFVNASGSMTLEQTVKLNYTVESLACHGDILYTCDKKIVRAYMTDGTQERVLCSYQNKCLKHIAVSDDGDKLYITRSGCFTIIDKKGEHLSTLITIRLRNPYSLCCFGDGSVLVGDYFLSNMSCSIVQVDSRGEQVIGTVLSMPNLSKGYISLCYDRKNSRLLAGHAFYDYLSVFELEYIEVPNGNA